MKARARSGGAERVTWRWSLALIVFAVTLFVSAFLLFLVQPMIGKMILPKLGGTPQVWNTCMVFFQTALLAGYGYTHSVSTFLKVRTQVLLHCLILFVPLLVLLPFMPFNVIRQPWLWTAGYLVLVALLLACAAMVLTGPPSVQLKTAGAGTATGTTPSTPAPTTTAPAPAPTEAPAPAPAASTEAPPPVG